MFFEFLPPEINSGRMYAGAGSSSLQEAAMAWQNLAVELEQYSVSSQAIVADLDAVWDGPSSVAMRDSIAPHIAWMQQASQDASDMATRIHTVIGAYHIAHSAVVPPAVITANRTHTSLLIATNFFGQNTPAIAANEAAYVGMWAQDATAMNQYAATSIMATTKLPTFGQLAASPSPTNIITQIINALLGGTPIWGIGNNALLGQYLQSAIGGSVFFAPTEVLSMLIPLLATQAVATEAAAALNSVSSAIATTGEATATGGSVRAAIGIANRVNTPLAPSVPPNWAQSSGDKSDVDISPSKEPTPVSLPPAIPIPPAIPVIMMGRSDQDRKHKPDPEYGQVSKVVPIRFKPGG